MSERAQLMEVLGTLERVLDGSAPLPQQSVQWAAAQITRVLDKPRMEVKAPAYSMGVLLGALERRRQVEVEGFNDPHDDAHGWDGKGNGELAVAGACYALRNYVYHGSPPFPEAFPFDEEWWKPKTPIRDLVRAQALIAADIDRLLLRDGIPEDVGALVAAHDPLCLALPAVVLNPVEAQSTRRAGLERGWWTTVLGEEYRIIPPPEHLQGDFGAAIGLLRIEHRVVVAHRSEQPEWQMIGTAGSLDLARGFILGHALQRAAVPAQEG